MKTLQNKLQHAVQSVFNLIEYGDSPRTAIVKTATAEHLLPDQVTRLCQLYNRSSSIAQRLAPGDLSTKLADAQVIDPRQVQQDISLRKNEKRASAPAIPVATQLVSVSLAELDKAELSPKVAKAPAEPEPVKVAAACKYDGIHHGMSVAEAVAFRDMIRSKIAALQHEGEQLLANANNRAALAMRAVSKSVPYPSNDLTTLKQAAFWCDQQSPELGDLMRSLASVTLTERAAVKWAEAPQVGDPPANWESGVVGPGSVTEAVSKCGTAMSFLRDELPEIAGKIAALREEDFIVKTHLTDSGVRNRDMVFGDKSLSDLQQEHLSKVAGLTSAYTGSFLAGKKSPPQTPDSSRTDQFRLQLQHPQHEATLQSIRARAALQSLLVDDPVLRSEPEDQVIAAYNEISAYSPNVTQNPATLRAVLRQYLQNNSSSFDLSQVRQLERDA